MEKMARFKFSANSSLIRGEGRFISDQDWSFSANEIGSNVGCNPLIMTGWGLVFRSALSKSCKQLPKGKVLSLQHRKTTRKLLRWNKTRQKIQYWRIKTHYPIVETVWANIKKIKWLTEKQVSTIRITKSNLFEFHRLPGKALSRLIYRKVPYLISSSLQSNLNNRPDTKVPKLLSVKYCKWNPY